MRWSTSTPLRAQHSIASQPPQLPLFRFHPVRTSIARPMLGRTCLRRLQAPRPYVCQPCLRTLRAAPPARPLDAFCAARRFHAVAVLHAQDNAAPAEDKLDKANTSGGDKENAPKKGKNSKARRREARKQAAEARKRSESPPKVRKILSSPGREENSDSPGAVENPSADDQGPQAEDGSETSKANTDIDAKEAKRADKRARHAARLLKRAAKAEMQKQNKKAGKNLDIGQVLERAAGNGAAEVLAAAAKTDRAQTLKAALLRTKKHPKKRQERDFVDSVLARDVQLTRKPRLHPSPCSANITSDRCGATANPPTLLWVRPCAVQVCVRGALITLGC